MKLFQLFNIDIFYRGFLLTMKKKKKKKKN